VARGGKSRLAARPPERANGEIVAWRDDWHGAGDAIVWYEREAVAPSEAQKAVSHNLNESEALLVACEIRQKSSLWQP